MAKTVCKDVWVDRFAPRGTTVKFVGNDNTYCRKGNEYHILKIGDVDGDCFIFLEEYPHMTFSISDFTQEICTGK